MKIFKAVECEGKECPIKETCYRYTSEPDKDWQAYMSTPYNKETNTCDYYWKTEIKKNEITYKRRIVRLMVS